MKRRINTAESVINQAKSRQTPPTDNVIPFAKHDLTGAHSFLHSRLDYTNHPKSGAPRLRAIFPGNKHPDEIDLSFLLVQRGLGPLLAEGFRNWGDTVAPTSRTALRGYLYSGFSKFLLTQPANIDPWTLDATFWTAFVRWLDAPRFGKNPYAVQTRRKSFGAVHICLSAVTEHALYGKIACYLLDESNFPHNLWLGSKTKVKPAFVLTPAEKEQTIRACLKEIAIIADLVRERATSLASA